QRLPAPAWLVGRVPKLLRQHDDVRRGFSAEFLQHEFLIAQPVLHGLGPLAGVIQRAHQAERAMGAEPVELSVTTPPPDRRADVLRRCPAPAPSAPPASTDTPPNVLRKSIRSI